MITTAIALLLVALVAAMHGFRFGIQKRSLVAMSEAKSSCDSEADSGSKSRKLR